jgi:hypothetical protein
MPTWEDDDLGDVSAALDNRLVFRLGDPVDIRIQSGFQAMHGREGVKQIPQGTQLYDQYAFSGHNRCAAAAQCASIYSLHGLFSSPHLDGGGRTVLHNAPFDTTFS